MNCRMGLTIFSEISFHYLNHLVFKQVIHKYKKIYMMRHTCIVSFLFIYPEQDFLFHCHSAKFYISCREPGLIMHN